jgi:serine-type D-Ala-D-Ala carboxypeptidase (penicillin-binding protein 5/6)
LTARDLLEALLLPSGCDAAYTLAKAYGPGLDAFIAKMNTEAQQMGLTSTYFSKDLAVDARGLSRPTRWPGGA